MATIQEINSAIMFGDFTNDQLNSIIAAVKFRRGQLTKESVRELRLGTRVKFTSSRNGSVILGSVQKINRKFVIVQEDRGNYLPRSWRVPASMLETV
jgi:hypothetical protein